MSGIQDLYNSIRQEKTVLFIGAGFSFKAGMPTCGDIKDHIIKYLPQEVIADYDINDLKNLNLQELSELYIENSDDGKFSLINLLQPLFQTKPKDLSDHKKLCSIPHFHRIYTTNYDNLLESFYGDNCVVIRGNNDIELLQSSKVQIIKLHGDFINTENFIISRSDYDNWFRHRNEDFIWQQLKLDFAKYNVLFIGYSLADSNLKTVIDYVNKFTKIKQRIHLVAPDMKQSKINQLNKQGIEFYAFTASDFFSQLIEILEKNIVRDSERRRVSLSTFHKFIELRNVVATILSSQNGNSLQSIKAVDGGKYNINFTIGGELYGRIFKNSRPVYDDVICTPSNFNIPCKKILREDLIDCDLSINNICIRDKENISYISIAPCYEQLICSIIVPSASYSNKFNFIRYSISNEVHFEMIFDGGKIHVTFHFDEVTKKLDFNISIKWSESFKNLGEYIKFIKALNEIWKRSEFKIQGVLPNTATLKLPVSYNHKFNFEPLLDYLNNLQQIEFITGESFESYSSFSDENYAISNVIVSYLSNKPIIYQIPKNSTMSFDMKAISEEQICGLVLGKIYSFCTTKESTAPLLLCGKSFNIKYQHDLYKKCRFSKINHVSGNCFHLEITILDDNYSSLYTNKLINS